MTNYYEILGCDINASYEELKKCYHEKIKKVHPDKTGMSSSRSEFSILDKAWKTLRDENSRREYDLSMSKQELIDTPVFCHVDLTEMKLDTGTDSYSYECRCGGMYALSSGQLNECEKVKSESLIPSLKSRIYTPARIRRRARMIEANENSHFFESSNTKPHNSVPKISESLLSVSLPKTSQEKKVLCPKDSNAQHSLKGIKSSSLTAVSNSAVNPVTTESNHSIDNHLLNLKTISSKNLSLSSSESVENIHEHTDLIKYSLKSPSSMRMPQRINILGTLLPDEILSDPINRKTRLYNTAVIFPDVSGFTQLCEKYDKTGKGGPSRLTEVLNGYLGSMIQIVLSRNGDVLKFGGDAFLCVWKVPADADIREVVYLAIESAVDIQKNCGEHNTDVGVKLGVKIAVAAGKALFSIIGTESRKHYVLVGPPVLDVREAELLCKSGDVIVAPSAWKYVENYMFYSYTYHANNSHIKVHDFGPLWKPTPLQMRDDRGEKKALEYRPLLKVTSRLKIENLRPFILTPVMKSIDQNHSLDYLTEMRQVAIVFFNIAVDFSSIPLEDLIDLSHKAFQIVSVVVDKNDGSVNKLTLFDKDMAILVVFGLKGFKHELASQVALKCAYNCLEQLKKLPIISASAAVTTGMAYCGVIGHLMRKEYTVMGRPVNMAARLMCAYPNIVSSDRDTFLHSKLESGHFEVLEAKCLKGIQHPGPFYKFNLHIKRSKLKLDYHAYPLLGRAKEIHEFEKFLENAMKKKGNINFMVIYGKARIGKSRLVAGLVNIAEKMNFMNPLRRRYKDKSNALEINVISLTEDDSKSSYSAIRLIFQQPLGLSETSSVEEREDKILSRLTETRDVFLLASFNPVFNVNFDLMPQYMNLSQQEQTDAQKALIRHLYIKCFPKGTKWLIVIEDAEYIDDESWILLELCSHESYSVAYLLTIGQRRVLSTIASSVLESLPTKNIILGEIEKWYFSGLACQALGVSAIPVELENLIQNYKNSGNPGWLESFLLTLVQSGSIYIHQASAHEIKNLRLVLAPKEMLSTTITAEDEKYDSSYWLDCVETFEKKSDLGHKTWNVCLLGPNFFDNSKNETDLTMDTIFINTIDTLKPLEQLVLKTGSVLGNSFKRSALKYLIAKDITVDERQLAKAIRNLFEIKIFVCAKGDPTVSNVMVPRKVILVSSIRKEITCECTGIIILEDCQDLPQYASCGYMQFRSPIFRDTVYNLLLDDQKKKYHSSSIEYLRKYTTKCKSCQNVPFPNVIGYDTDDQITLVCNSSPMHGVRTTKLDPKARFSIPSIRNRLLNGLRARRSSRSRKFSQNFEVEFGKISVEDGGDCQCTEILASVYSVLLEHAAGSGRKDIMLEVQLEYASLSLTSYNIPLTMQILEDALALVNQMKEDKEYPEFCTPYIFSKIYTLMGATKLNMGRPDTSVEYLETSLGYMKKSLPKSKMKLKFLIKRENLRRLVITEYMPEKFLGKTSDKKASSLDLLSECLCLISLVHIYMEDWLTAKFASTWALNEALQSNRNFFGLCTAYTNMIDVAYHYKDLDTCSKMELCAIDVCKRCTKRIIEIYELEAICRLYKVIFHARHMRAEIEEAVSIGFQSIRIASVVRSASLRLDLMPDLIFALIQLNRLSEAASLLHELEFTSQLDSDKSSRIWYYALCLDFQLDSGFTVIPYDTCQNFVKEEEESFQTVRDPNCKYRLYSGLWLWCIRHDEWDLSKSYAKTLKSFNIIDVSQTPCTVFTRLRRLEGFLISLVHRMDTKNIYAITSTYTEIHALMAKLEKDTQVVKLLKPRYLLLKAYYKQIKYRDDSCFRIMNQALAMADKMQDKNTYEWINHLKMVMFHCITQAARSVWSNAISPIQRDYWIEHCRYNLIDWHEANGNTRKQSVMYSLPLPKF